MKHFGMMEKPRFTAGAKSAAFLRGLLAARPLVEVAVEAFSHKISDESQVRYASRIARSGDSEAACEAIRSGVPCARAERILADAVSSVESAYSLLINSNAHSDEAQESLAGKCASPEMAVPCYILLKLKTVSSIRAQEILAQAVSEGGLSDRAAELLLQGSLESEAAQKLVSGIVPEDHATIARILISGRMGIEAAKILSARMPPVCAVSEESG